ncbi:MAG: PD-(D/E)XK nuclease family protein [Lawsonibacter sp.]|jgi:ATP-dependent helicase/nuclease subunit B
MLQLQFGRSGTENTTWIMERLCQAGQNLPQVLIVPEQQSHQMERRLCQMGGDGVCLYAEVLSFSRLANRVFQEAGGLAEEELDGGGRLLLMYQAVRSVSGQLTVYSRPSRRPTFLQSLLATVDELKSCCVPPEALIRAGEENTGMEGEKLRDLGLICGAYEALTHQIALDPRDQLTRASEKLETCSWGQGKDLWLDGFTDFTPQQEQLLRQLMRQAHTMTVSLICDHLEEDEDGTGIFSPARRTAARLMNLAKKEGIAVSILQCEGENREKEEPLRFLEEHIFGGKETGPVLCGGLVELFQAATPRSEVEWAAAQILKLVRDEKVRFREIGVVARNYTAYRDLVESVFPRYGVPVFSSVMSDILEKPVLALVTGALEAAAGGYEYEDMFRYLKTGLTDLPEEERDLLENYVLKWDIKGSRWTQEKDWNWHPRGYGFQLEEQDHMQLQRLDQARRRVAAPLERLRKNKVQTGRGQSIAMYELLEEIGLPHRLEERVATLQAQGELTLADEYRQLWKILCGGLEQCAALLGDAPMDLEEFSHLFRMVLSQYHVGSIPVSLDRVTAGEMTRQIGHPVKVLVLLGADDHSIPQLETAPGLLTDDDRQLLSSYGLELSRSARELLYREMTTVYLTCVRPTSRLLVSWPTIGAGGEECHPGFLVARLRVLFSDLAISREEELHQRYRLQAPLPALEQVGRDPLARMALEQLPDYREKVSLVCQAKDWNRGHLSRQAVTCLYGQKVAMSASRMDKYKSCHFSYFMRYGLQAELRKPAGFAAPEYGTFVHYVLEHVLQDTLFQQTKLPGAAPELGETEKGYLRRLTKQAVDQYVQEELGGLDGQSQRFQYLFRRLLKSVQAVVENVAEELYTSAFRPISFELGFGRSAELPPVEWEQDGVTISVSGFVDRVDGWVHDGRLYLRVVDYKTGRKSFDLTEVFHGLGLQMLLYLFTLEEKGEAFYGLPVEGAGVLYLPAREAVIRGNRGMSEEAWRKAVDKELTRSGLVLNDPVVLQAMEPAGEEGYRFLPLRVSKSTGTITGEALANAEQLGKLGRHIQAILGEICSELAHGTISADPFWRGPEKNACRFCEYAAACHFEEGRGEDQKRWFASVHAPEFWSELSEAEKEPSPQG